MKNIPVLRLETEPDKTKKHSADVNKYLQKQLSTEQSQKSVSPLKTIQSTYKLC